MAELREHPSKDSESRQNRAEKVHIEEIREIDGSAFDVPDDYTVYEVDLLNEDGEPRENVTIIPRILFESTKDVQYRHEYGIVGKYTRALAMEHEGAQEELVTAIAEKRNSVQDETKFLKEKDSRLLHTLADMGEV